MTGSRHAVLLGDSVFDNRAYVERGEDVISHLRALLPSDWRATLCAVDGSTSEHVLGQIHSVPPDATDLVVSMGGNDALQCRDLLDRRVGSTAEALALFAAVCGRFSATYNRSLDRLAALERPVTVCTIYDANFEMPEAGIVPTALAMFNDVILRAALRRRLAVIDLRLVCTEPGDYANRIEPSGRGSAKIARAIAAAIGAPF